MSEISPDRDRGERPIDGYEPPAVKDLGSVADVTAGTQPNGNDAGIAGSGLV